MGWVVTAIAVSAGASIHASNVAGAAQRSAMARQQADMGFSIAFNEEVTRVEQTKAQIGFEQEFNRRLEAYNDVRSQQLAVVGYQGRTMDSLSNIIKADEKQWEYDTMVMEINNNINQKSIAIGNMQSTLGMSSQIAGLNASMAASKSAQTWGNIATVAGAGAQAGMYNAKYGGGSGGGSDGGSSGGTWGDGIN